MQHTMNIRDETAADIESIAAVTIAAFRTLEVSQQTEHLIIQELRRARALTVSLVAEVAGEVIGHIAFSPVSISDGTTGWYGLGPLAVLPRWHRQGVGKALIEAGLTRLRGLNARGCCLVGHPQYYGRFGFQNVTGLGYAGARPEVFFALPFDGRLPQGNVTYHAAFYS
jgi:putative acetyltransferase